MKGITQALRTLKPNERIIVTDLDRSDIYKIAGRVGIKVKCEKFDGGFWVTRVEVQKRAV